MMSEEQVTDDIHWTKTIDGRIIQALPSQIVEIAKYVQENVSPDNFDTVFNAIVQMRFRTTYTIASGAEITPIDWTEEKPKHKIPDWLWK
jgi:hypothetical protein